MQKKKLVLKPPALPPPQYLYDEQDEEEDPDKTPVDDEEDPDATPVSPSETYVPTEIPEEELEHEERDPGATKNRLALYDFSLSEDESPVMAAIEDAPQLRPPR
eukprot:2125020-Karenia_brevis.AAC.1